MDVLYEREHPPDLNPFAQARSYLTESVYKVVLQKSIPEQIRQLILYISNNKGYVYGFVQELTFAKRHFL